MASSTRTQRLFLVGAALALLLVVLAPTAATAQSGPGDNPDEPPVASTPAPDRVLFLRGDRGVSLSGSEVTTWADQSGNDYDATPSGTTGPEFIPAPTGFNDKPALRFDRANDEEGLEVPNTNDINTGGPYPERTISLTFRTGSDVSSRQVLYEEGGGTNGLNVYLENGFVTASAWDSGWSGQYIGEGQYAVSSSVDPNTTYTLTFVFDADAGDALQLYLNGDPEATNDDASIGPVSSHGGNIFVGNVGDGTQIEGNDVSAQDGFGGDIAEVVLSNTAVNTAQRQILESALSEKYDISITNDRYAQAGYANDVVGVGQAGDGTKQTSDARGVLSVSTSSLANGNFGLLGHEGSNATFEGETDPTNIGERLSRVWRVGGTGTLPSLTVEFDVSNYSLGSNQDYKLLLESSGGTFGSGATVVDGTLNGDTFTVSSSALSSAGLAQGDYLTLAKTSGDVTAPAGLSYSPNPVTVAKEDVSPGTATASFTTEGQPAPSFTVVEVRRGFAGSASTTTNSPTLPDGITLEGDGDVTVDPTASSQGRFEIDIEASNSGGTSNTATLAVEITEEVSVEYTSQTVSVQSDGTFPSLSVTPTSPSINEGSRTFAVASGSLPAGLSLQSNGDVTGTPTETGRGRAVIEVSGSNMATGTAQDTLNLSVIGSAGPAGVGNDPADGTDAGAITLDLDASALAKSDGETVSTWTDGSNYGNDATGGDATYVGGVSGLNDRPAVDLSGATQPLTFNSDQFNNDTNAPFHQRTITVAFQTGSSIPSGSTPESIYMEGGGTNGISMYLRNSNLYVGMWSNSEGWDAKFVNALNDEGAAGEGTLGSIDPNTAYVVTLVFNADSTRFSAYVNGTRIGTQATDVAALSNHAEVVIGGGFDGRSYDVDGGGEAVYDQFTGEIAEVVVYDSALPEAQRQILESGLGAKYGIGVANSRFDFAGTEEFTFGSDVVGFGQTADNPNPHTPQVVSNLLTVSPGAALSDGDFTMVGTDDSSAVFSQEADLTDFRGDGTTTTDDDVGSRLVRTWRVDVTNTAAFSYGDLTVDVQDLTLLDGQTFVLLADADPTFTGSATVVEGTVDSSATDTTFTPDGTVHGAALADANYVTLARTVGDAVAPSNLTYAPNTLVIENGIGPDSTAAPLFDGGSPAPTFSIDGASLDNPSAVTVDAGTGVLTVDAETSDQGVFEVEVEASNVDGASGGIADDTVTVRIVEPAELNYDLPSQTAVVDDGSFNAIQTATPTDFSTVNDATVNYSVVEGSLGGLTLNSDGTITGTPTQTGLIRAVIQATGSGGAAGTATEEMNVTVVGADGPGNVGDAFGDGTDQGGIVAHFDAGALSAGNGDELNAWPDVSNYGNTVNLNAGAGPLYRTGENTTGFNGQPAVDFSNASGPSDLLVMQDNPEFNSGGAPYVQRTVTTVFRTSDDISSNQPEGIFGEGGGTRGISIYTRDGDLYAGMWNDAEDDETGPWGPHFFSAETDDGASGEGTVTINGDETYLVTLRYHFVESELAVYVNGTLVGKKTTNIGRFFDHGNAVLGGGESFVYDNGTTNYDEFEGQIGELLVYNVALPDAQRQILESALGAKYGVSPVANARFTDATYNRNVVGFGQLSDNPAPHDPSTETDIIAIAPTVLSDGDFAVIGHDDSSNVFAPETDLDNYRNDGTTTTDDQIDSRLQRTWRVAVSGNGAFDADNLTFDISAPAFDLADGQEYAILIGTGAEFPGDTKVVTGTTDTTATDTTFTPGTDTDILDGNYITLAKKLGDPAPPSNLSYPTISVEAGSGNTETGAPSYDGGQPLPSFGVVDADNPLPSGISIDATTGGISVDASTANQGVFNFDVFAETDGEGADTTTVNVRVFEQLEDATLALTLPDGETLSGTGLNFTPALSGLNDANISYTVERVNRFGTIEGDLSNSGLSFDPSAGTFSGAPSSLGTVAVTIEATGSGGAEGTVRARAKITKIGSTGLAGIGDPTTTILDLSADNLSSLVDGDPVSTWPDISAYENDATAGTAPTYKTGVLNGQPTVRFDGSGDQLSIASSPSINEPSPILHRAYTVVFQADDVSGTREIYNEQGGVRGYRLYIDGGELRVEGRNNSTSDDLVDPANDNLSSSADPTTPWENETSGDGDVLATTSVTANQTYVATLFHDYARGTIELWVNGEPKDSADGAGRQYGHTNGVIGTGSFDGDLGTLYATDASLNTTQRTLLHNALAAQYDASLAGGATDVYAGHTGGNGDYDLGVFGVGREAATDLHTAAEADGLRFDGISGLDSNDDYLVVGHGVSNNSVTTSDVTAGNVSLKARSARTWYVDETDSGSGLTVNITFDLDEAGLKGPAGDAANYTLLARGAGTSNDWTDLKTAKGLTVTTSGSNITFQGADLTSGDEITLGTTDRETSPLDTGEQALVIEGTAGTDGVDQGWRYLGFPGRSGASTPPQAKDLQRADGSQFINFGVQMAYRNDGEEAGSGSQSFGGLNFDGSGFAPLSKNEEVGLGRGFIVWIYDDQLYPVDPSITLQTPDGFNKVGATDITVGDESPSQEADPVLDQTKELFLLANPYAEPFDLGSLYFRDSGSNTGPGGDNFDDVVQVWEPDADDSGNDVSDRDDANVGSFVTRSRSNGDDIAPWQGFLLTRSSDNGVGGTTVTFHSDGRLTGNTSVPFVGSKSKADARVAERHIALEVVGRASDSTVVSIDKAASVLFRQGAVRGRDSYDAPKIAPMSGGGVLSPVATAPSDTSLRAQESRPLPDREAVVPLAFQAGKEAETYTLQGSEWRGVPESWSVELVDTKRTATKGDDQMYRLEPGGPGYTFTAHADAKARMENTATAKSGVGGGAVPPRPQFGRLRWAPGEGKSGGTGPSGDGPSGDGPSGEGLPEHGPSGNVSSREAGTTKAAGSQTAVRSPLTRFQLRVTPDQQALPVEMAGFEVRADREGATLTWKTASETGNAGFEVQHQRLGGAEGDTTLSDAAWTKIGFVEGGGTTTEPRSYRFETENLAVGRHAFRLRQVDTDGSAHVGETERVAVWLEEAYAVGAPSPNPARQQARLDLTVREKQPVRVRIYDVLGRQVSTIRVGALPAQQTRTVMLPVHRLSSGQYFVRVRGKHFAVTRRMTVVR